MKGGVGDSEADGTGVVATVGAGAGGVAGATGAGAGAGGGEGGVELIDTGWGQEHIYLWGCQVTSREYTTFPVQ